MEIDSCKRKMDDNKFDLLLFPDIVIIKCNTNANFGEKIIKDIPYFIVISKRTSLSSQRSAEGAAVFSGSLLTGGFCILSLSLAFLLSKSSEKIITNENKRPRSWEYHS